MFCNPFEKILFTETVSGSGIELDIRFFDGTRMVSLINRNTNQQTFSKTFPPHKSRILKRLDEWRHPTFEDGLVFESLEDLMDHYGITKSKYYRLKKKQEHLLETKNQPTND